MNRKFRNTFLPLTILCFLACGWKMYQLAASDSLWGYWTLGFLAAGWATWLLFFIKIYIIEGNHRWFLLSILSGFLFVGGFPNSPLTPLLFIAFVPLLIIAEEISESKERNKKRILMRYLFNAFVIWNIGSTWWVSNAGIIPGLIANFVNALFMCIPFLFYYIFKQRLSKNLSALAFVCFWLSWEYLHLNWELSWPWLTLGNAFAQHPTWIQWYEYTGVFGGSLWILVLNVMLFEVSKGLVSFRKIMMPLIILLLPFIWSFYLKASWHSIYGEKMIEICVVQPNYEPHYEKFKLPDDVQLERFLDLSLKCVRPSTNYLLFPETSFGYYNVDNLGSYPTIRKLQDLTDSFPNLHIVSGMDLFKIYEPAENLPRSVRKTGRGLMEIYNGAVQVSKSSTEIPYYKKGKMVPGAEMFPFRDFLGFLEPLFHKFNGTVEGLGTQAERSVFFNENQGVAIAPLICYESVYGAYCTDYVNKGAQALFIMTNDGWWDDTPGYMQHLKFASLRAIELRRAIARSANSGSSAFIDRDGSIDQFTAYNQQDVIKESLQLYSEITFYTLYGDYIAKIAVALLAMLFVIFGYTLIKS
ncbi:MAG: apolipoprotein N-acyltransferase [Saprospiraceae bacterium]